MTAITANGITIEYDTFGSDREQPLLLIMGLGAQMTRWPENFCDMLADAGHYVIRFDNRDVGLSHKFEEAGIPDMMEIFAQAQAGEPVSAPYSLSDMAADAVGLLSALEIEQAHICGASLGGMVAQMVAIEHPERTLSLTSIMSSTGNPELPPSTPEAQAALLSPAGTTREEVTSRAVAVNKVIGSPEYPADADEIRARAEADFDRAFHPAGVARQMAAVAATGNRKPRLTDVEVPTLVIHGKADPLVPVEGGIDTHEAVRNSRLHLIDGMGHDLPAALHREIVDAIAALTRP